MIRKYKIGNFTVEVKSQVDFQDVEPYSLFLYDGEQTDYCVNVEFTSELATEIEKTCYFSAEKDCVYKNGILHCYYKSRDTKGRYYACRITDGKTITIIIDDQYRDMLWTRVIFSLIGIEEIVAKNNGCVLHSSFVEKNGGAVLFTGPCSIGKSTQANLWKKYTDAVVVNGDKTFIFEEDGAVYAAGMPFSGSSKDCLNRVVPLKAIIRLHQSDCNSAEKIKSDEAFFEIYKNCYPVPYSRDCTGMLIDFIQKVSQKVPVYEYACLADESAVRHLERELCPILQSL